MFRPGTDEAKVDERAEKRNMALQREQNIIALNAPEEQTEITNEVGKADLIRWQQDLDPEMERIAYRLTGWTKQQDGSWTKTKGKKPLCNNKFMDDVVAPQLEPFLTKNLINTNLTEERILLNLRNTADDIASNMADGFDIYEIEFMNYDIVLRLLKNTMSASMFRALKGWTKKQDSQIHKILESSFDNPNAKESQGLFRGAFGK